MEKTAPGNTLVIGFLSRMKSIDRTNQRHLVLQMFSRLDVGKGRKHMEKKQSS